jgi:hypothetical protein
LAWRFVCRFFAAVVSASASNRMSMRNLVLCVGPSLPFAPGWLKWCVLSVGHV